MPSTRPSHPAPFGETFRVASSPTDGRATVDAALADAVAKPAGASDGAGNVHTG